VSDILFGDGQIASVYPSTTLSLATHSGKAEPGDILITKIVGQPTVFRNGV